MVDFGYDVADYREIDPIFGTMEDCMRLMTEHRIRHLPVLEENQILGVISIGDLVNWIISAQTTTIHQLQTYIAGIPG